MNVLKILPDSDLFSICFQSDPLKSMRRNGNLRISIKRATKIIENVCVISFWKFVDENVVFNLLPDLR